MNILDPHDNKFKSQISTPALHQQKKILPNNMSNSNLILPHLNNPSFPKGNQTGSFNMSVNNTFDSNMKSNAFGKSKRNSAYRSQCLNQSGMTRNNSTYMSNNCFSTDRFFDSRIHEKSQMLGKLKDHDDVFNTTCEILDQASGLFNVKKIDMGKQLLNHFSNYNKNQSKKDEDYYYCTSYPSYRIKEKIPVGVDLRDKNACYLWIQCSNRRFPAKIVTSLKTMEFEYYCKMVNQNDQLNFEENRQFITEQKQDGTTAHRSFKTANMIDKIYSDIDFNTNFDKPTPLTSDVKEMGGDVEIWPDKKHMEKGSDIDFLIVLIMSPKKLRATFSIGFAGIKSSEDNIPFFDQEFGKVVKSCLFGTTRMKTKMQMVRMSTMKRKQNMNDDSPYSRKKGNIISENKTIAKFYNDYKRNTITNLVTEFDTKSKQVKDRVLALREERKHNNEQRLNLYDFKMQRAKLRKIEYMKEKLRLQKCSRLYKFWITQKYLEKILKKLQKLPRIKTVLKTINVIKKKSIYYQFFRKTRALIREQNDAKIDKVGLSKVQRCWRKKTQEDKIEDKASKNLGYVKYALNLFVNNCCKNQINLKTDEDESVNN